LKKYLTNRNACDIIDKHSAKEADGILKIEQQTNLKEKKKNPEIPRESEVRTTERLEEQSLPKEKRSSESARVNKGIVR